MNGARGGAWYMPGPAQVLRNNVAGPVAQLRRAMMHCGDGGRGRKYRCADMNKVLQVIGGWPVGLCYRAKSGEGIANKLPIGPKQTNP